MKVFILATVRKPELLPYTLLVFKTLRIGFPTAEIFVTGNALKVDISGDIESMCGITGYCDMGVPTIHHEWIERLVAEENEPFVICDTDMVFYDKVEDWKFDSALAGYRIPEFVDEFTCAVTKPRLHTSLLYIDPVKAREAIAKYEAQFPDTIFNPKVNLFYPLCLPNEGGGSFYDTCSLLYQAIGGTEFTDAQKEAYAHLHFGTIGDLVLPRLKNGHEMGAARKTILENPEYGRGLWRAQEDYYNARQVIREGKNVIAPVTPEDSAVARKWNAELCCGNEVAMSFTDLWYGYCHAIDDAVDTMIDGRLTMSKEQLISVFFHAAKLYNHPYYLANQSFFFPLILDITHTYAVSVGWERATEPHLRAMADVLRTAGNRLYWGVALLSGGEQHALDMIRKIHDRDWRGQHDAQGRPI